MLVTAIVTQESERKMNKKVFSIVMLELFLLMIAIVQAKNIEHFAQTQEALDGWFFSGAYATYLIEVEEIWEGTRNGTATVRFEIIDVYESEVQYEFQVLENVLPEGYGPLSFVKTVNKSSLLSETGWFDRITGGSHETIQIDNQSYSTKKVSVHVLHQIWRWLGVVEETITRMTAEAIAWTNNQSGAWLEKNTGLLLKVEFFGLASYTGAGIANRSMTLKETNVPIVSTATVNLNPGTLNLKSKGKWITTYIELPENYNVSDINRTTILLNDTIPVDSFWVDKPLQSVIGDYDEDGIPDLMFKFDRAKVIKLISDAISSSNNKFMEVALTLTGQFFDGTYFQGNDTIRIVSPYEQKSHKYTFTLI